MLADISDFMIFDVLGKPVPADVWIVLILRKSPATKQNEPPRIALG